MNRMELVFLEGLSANLGSVGLDSVKIVNEHESKLKPNVWSA
jgi:hypothetical protein